MPRGDSNQPAAVGIHGRGSSKPTSIAYAPQLQVVIVLRRQSVPEHRRDAADDEHAASGYTAGGGRPRNIEAGAAAAERVGVEEVAEDPESGLDRRSRHYAISGRGYFVLNRTRTLPSRPCYSALQDGKRELARGEFAKAVRDNPRTAAPHVFLARLSREEGTQPVHDRNSTRPRLEPRTRRCAPRDGSHTLRSRQYDLARRFLRARGWQANDDKAAQGYLGCSMMVSIGLHEGTRWINKGGSGPLDACLQTRHNGDPSAL